MKGPAGRAPFLRRITLLEERSDRSRHPFNVPAFKHGIDIALEKNVTFFVGENGSGKSTLLEAIARSVGFGEQGGNRDQGIHHDDDEPPGLAEALRLSWKPKMTDGFFMRAESFFNFASYVDRGNLTRYGGVPLHEQSHGESFLALFANRLQRGIFILDEPEAALSPQRQLAFLKIIHRLDTSGRAQFLIASHSPILLAYPFATLLDLDGDSIAPVAYQQTAHYRITREFLEAPERYFKHLFAPDEDE
jgi:predicted ATPase